MEAQESKPKLTVTICQEDIERWFAILEYLLIKGTFLALAAIGAYHLITRA